MRSVFIDPTGRRAQHAAWARSVFILAACVLACIFVVSLVVRPNLPSASGKIETLTGFRPAQAFAAAKRAQKAKDKLMREIRQQEHTSSPKIPTKTGIVAAYYAPWRTSGEDDFVARAASLTHVFAAWLTLNASGTAIDTRHWDLHFYPHRPRFESIARQNHVRLIPVISNAEDGVFDTKRVAAMLGDPQRANAMKTTLVNFIQTHAYDGLQIDFEQLDAPTIAALIPWVHELHTLLHKNGKSLSIAMQPDWNDTAIRALGSAADFVIIMAYDEHEDESAPGPVASAEFVRTTAERFKRLIPVQKLVMGIGTYGYDWAENEPRAQVLSFADSMALARRVRGPSVDFDQAFLNPTFNYRDDLHKEHEVWFLDAVTAYNQHRIASVSGIEGFALWALGMEDPSIWKIFGRAPKTYPESLKVLESPGEVQFSGDGEILRVADTPHAGTRSLAVDAQTGLITDATYDRFPSSYLIERQGAREKQIALTFDDGPDPIYTPQVLRMLATYHIPATFFVIGQAAASHPDLIRAIVKEGHEIGSHSYTHPNMGLVSHQRAVLELTATQRAIESITGRSVRLFRPPFNADSEPRTKEEVQPIVVANSLGYLVAGESIDPTDWNLEHRNFDGSVHRLTSDDIVHSVLKQIDRGNTVLFHDAGGDRSATVAALGQLIPLLQSQGYRFVTMGALGGMDLNQTMPRIDAKQMTLVGFDRVAFWLARDLESIISIGFILSIGLGFARIVFMTGLASLFQKDPPLGQGMPQIDVLIAAYNEETVIVRTIASILASDYQRLGIIVVDDGSTDQTAQVVRTAFHNEDRVRLIQKTNGGKASALNMALALSQADVVIGVDADTQLALDAVRILASHFDAPDVAAVAGNVKVGNRVNLLTRWQSIEYICAQNIDRRALGGLNAISVVPGALGAWRRSALLALGGYEHDTLAEDMDLTWRVRQNEWVIVNEPRAQAFTEAPEGIRALFKQRFRWTFGTLQCLWKHRRALFRYGWFGRLTLPSLWLFQIAAQILAPFVDLQLVWALGSWFLRLGISGDQADLGATGLDLEPILRITGVWLAFLLVEWGAGLYAYRLDKEPPRDLLLLPLQRFVYRQVMYVVLWRALGRAIAGLGQGWGKLDRRATVNISSHHPYPVVNPQGEPQ